MNHRQPTDSELLRIRIDIARNDAFRSIVPESISRRERRSVIGKMLLAQGELAATKAELEILRAEILIED